MTVKVLVTGAAGTVGHGACRALVEGGMDVVGLDRAYRRDMPCRLELVDLLDDRAVYGPMEGCSAVVHLANHPNVYAGPPPARIYAENVAMNAHVFQAAVDIGVDCIVFSSSVQVISGSRHGEEDADKPSSLSYLPVDGAMPARPGNNYALSKQAGEMAMRYYAAQNPEGSFTTLRLPGVVDPERMHWWRRRRSHREARAWGPLDEAFAYIALDEASAVVRAAVERRLPGYHQYMPASRDHHISLSIPEIIDRSFKDVPLKVPADQMESLVDCSEITRDLGWTCRGDSVFSEAE